MIKKKFQDYTVCLIPARGNSKSVPLKNLYKLNGKPLIHYCLSTVKKSKNIFRVFCSTESIKIKSYCKNLKINVVDRPKKLSSDDTPTVDVINHFLENYYIKEEHYPERLLLLEPTSPFVTVEQIDECISILKKNKKATSSQTIAEVPPNHHSINQRAIQGEWCKFIYPELRFKQYNKQLKTKQYVHGNLRVIRCKEFLKSGDLFGNKSIGKIIPRIYSMDVDAYEDFQLAEIILKSNILEKFNDW